MSVDSEAATANNIHIQVDQNGDTDDKTVKSDGELSPSSLRRSTRTSALKAQEKLKIKETIIDSGTVIDSGMVMVENGNFPGRSIEHDEDLVNGAPKKKKPKLNDGSNLDQYDCKFGIRMDDEGDVVMMTDESEISSLNAEEVSDLRVLYNDFKKHQVSDEQMKLRDQQIAEMEANLRLEEAKLAMLKKIRQCQQQNAKMAKVEAAKAAASAAPAVQNSMTNAYKPAIATPQTKMNGTSNKANKVSSKNTAQQNMIQALASMTPQQQQQLLQNLAQNPMLASQAQHITAVLEALRQQQQQAKSGGQQSTPSAPARSGTPVTAATAKATPTATATPETRTQPSATSQQRAAAARLALRREIEKQLLQIPQPKAPPVELNFIPNGIQPDFCYLLGLDLTVQRVLKDKQVFKRVEVSPYQCEECGTDFTPCWKAIGTNENDLHLYCEQCVKQAQKRKMKNDHTAVYKKVFQKISEREKELEKQIAAGKFDDPVPPPPPPQPAPSAKATATITSTPLGGNLGGTPQATATAHVKSTPSTSTTPQVNKANPTVTPKQKRTPATGNTGSPANNQSATQMMAAFQQQLATLTALRQSNPMMAALFSQSNPLLALQAQAMWNPMLAAAAAQAQAQTRPNVQSSNNVNPAAQMLAMLAQAQQQQQQQQQQSQQRSSSTTNTTSSNSNTNSSGGSAAAAMQQAQQQGIIAAAMAALSGGNSQGITPQLLNQLKQLQANMAKKK